MALSSLVFQTSGGEVVCAACRLETDRAEPIEEEAAVCERCGRSCDNDLLQRIAAGTVTADEMVDILFDFGDELLL